MERKTGYFIMSTHPISIALSLFFVINVLGNIPLFVGLLSKYPPPRQRVILTREFLFALILLLLFNFFGAKIFHMLGISQPILGMAGGILLLLIAIKMIFPHHDQEKNPNHEPMLVPLATPIIAGPGSITAVMLFSSRMADPLKMSIIIIITMGISAIIGLLASIFKYALGEKGLLAIERLGGMIIALISIQMFATGAIDFVKTSFGL